MTETRDDGQPLAEVFDLIAQLSLAKGIHPICDIPGCAELFVPSEGESGWLIAVNGHAIEFKFEKAGTMGCDVPPFNGAVFWNGWLAGIVSPFGGVIAAHPTGANEERLIRDLERAITLAKGDETIGT